MARLTRKYVSSDRIYYQLAYPTTRRTGDETQQMTTCLIRTFCCMINWILLSLALIGLLLYLYVQSQTQLQPYKDHEAEEAAAHQQQIRQILEQTKLNQFVSNDTRSAFNGTRLAMQHRKASQEMLTVFKAAVSRLQMIPTENLKAHQRLILESFKLCKRSNRTEEFVWLANHLNQTSIPIPILENMRQDLNPFKMAFLFFRDFALNNAFITIRQTAISQSNPTTTAKSPDQQEQQGKRTFIRHPVVQIAPMIPIGLSANVSKFSVQMIRNFHHFVQIGRNVTFPRIFLDKVTVKLERYLEKLRDHFLKENLGKPVSPNVLKIRPLAKVLPFKPFQAHPSFAVTSDAAMDFQTVRKWIWIVNSGKKLAYILLIGQLVQLLIEERDAECASIFFDPQKPFLTAEATRILFEADHELLEIRRQLLMTHQDYVQKIIRNLHNKHDSSLLEISKQNHRRMQMEDKLRHLQVSIGYHNVDQFNRAVFRRTLSRLFPSPTAVYEEKDSDDRSSQNSTAIKTIANTTSTLTPTNFLDLYSRYSTFFTYRRFLTMNQKNRESINDRQHYSLAFGHPATYDPVRNRITFGLETLFWPLAHLDVSFSMENAQNLAAASPIDSVIDASNGMKYDIQGFYTASAADSNNSQLEELAAGGVRFESDEERMEFRRKQFESFVDSANDLDEF